MLDWSASIFQLVGPLNEVSESAIADCGEMFGFVQSVDRSDVKPTSFADRIFSLRDDGTITADEAARMLVDFIRPALDTPIFGMTNMPLLPGRYRDQWDKLKVGGFALRLRA